MSKNAKKGGGGKDGGKTEEEKLQEAARAEEEKAKKKAETRSLFLKDKLETEVKKTAVNLLKLNEGWRLIRRHTRGVELRHDITVLRQTFERQLIGLDTVVKNLEGDLQEAERQSAQVRRVHLQNVDRLSAQQGKRLMIVQQQWENGLQHLSSRFSWERNQMSLHSQQQQADLEEATFSLEQQHIVVMFEIRRLYSESIASCQRSYEKRRDALNPQDKLKEKTLENQKVVQLCGAESKALDILLTSPQQVTQMVDANVNKVERLQYFASRLRKKTEQDRIKPAEQDLRAAKNQLNQKTRMLRDQLIQARTAARKQLVDLTMQSDNAAKKLQAVIAKGEKVLKLGEICRKLESRQKQVLLFPAEELRQERTGPETEEPAKLQQVTQRINVAVLQREALRKEDNLSRENRQLRLRLRQHQNPMVVHGNTLDGRQRSAHRVPGTDHCGPAGRHTVIETVHVVNHSR